MLSLASKCVFDRPKHDINWRPHGTEYLRSWNTKNGIYQWIEIIVDEKNGVICVAIMFTLRVTVTKMPKDGSFLHFSKN